MGRLVKGMFGNRCSRSVGGNGQSFATCGKCLLSEATGMVRNVQVCSVSHRLFTVFSPSFTVFSLPSTAVLLLPQVCHLTHFAGSNGAFEPTPGGRPCRPQPLQLAAC